MCHMVVLWQGESGSTSAQDYPGPSSASEPEVQAVIKYQKENLATADAGIDYHSYGMHTSQLHRNHCNLCNGR